MARLRTPEQLKQLFQLTKERKEKERQQQRLEKQQQYQELCKEADRLLKEDQERLKKEKTEQLQALAKKTPQNALKRFYINLTNNRWIDDSYTMDFTREELERMCPHCINWKKWDEVVEQTRQQQLGITNAKPLKHKKKKTRLWTYSNGQLLNEYIDCSAAAKEFGVSLVTIYSYMAKRKTIKGITFSNKPIKPL